MGVSAAGEHTPPHQAIRAFALAGCAYYLFLAAAHAIVLPSPLAAPMVGTAATTACAFALAAWRLRLPRHLLECEVLSVALFIAACANIVMHAVVTGDGSVVQYLPIMCIGFALLAPSARTMTLAIATQIGAALALFATGAAIAAVHDFFLLGTAAFGGAVTANARRRAMHRLLLARQEADRLRGEATRWAQELEERIKERTAELQQTTDRLQIALQAKTDFLAAMSHELRTPLNAILGYAGVIRDDLPPDAGAANDLARIEAAANRLQGLVDELLDAGGAARERSKALV